MAQLLHGTTIATITRPKNNGEENWQIGQNWAICLEHMMEDHSAKIMILKK